MREMVDVEAQPNVPTSSEIERPNVVVEDPATDDVVIACLVASEVDVLNDVSKVVFVFEWLSEMIGEVVVTWVAVDGCSVDC